MQPIYRFSHTERLFFPSRPDRETRLALRAAGWRWDRNGNWWRNHQQMAPVKKAELSNLLTPIAQPVTA